MAHSTHKLYVNSEFWWIKKTNWITGNQELFLLSQAQPSFELFYGLTKQEDISFPSFFISTLSTHTDSNDNINTAT